jgi:hypothetical protein
LYYCLALRQEYPGIFETPTIFTNVCACDETAAKFQPFWLFFDCLIASIAGKKIWTNRDKVGEPITIGNKISIVDEAFTISIKNYWPKWFSNHGLKAPAKWTDLRQGNSQSMCWHEDAYKRFDLVCRRIQLQSVWHQSI